MLAHLANGLHLIQCKLSFLDRHLAVFELGFHLGVLELQLLHRVDRIRVGLWQQLVNIGNAHGLVILLIGVTDVVHLGITLGGLQYGLGPGKALPVAAL